MKKQLIKTVTIVRGGVGNAKTTLSKKLDNGRGYEIAADDFPLLYVNGKYQQHLQKESHQWCKNMVESWMKEGIQDIIVHNTFVEEQYYLPYIELAQKYGYATHIVTSEGVILPNGDRTKSEHNVPDEIAKSMLRRFEPFNKPPKRGITLNEIAAEMSNIKKPDILIFDMDQTIKYTPGSKTFPTSPDDFELTSEFKKWMSNYIQMPNVLVYVVSNQMGVNFGHKKIDFLKQEIENVISKLHFCVDGVYANISDDKCLFYNPFSEMWHEKIKSLSKNNLEDIPKPGIFTFKDIHYRHRQETKIWIIGDSHTDKMPTDWEYTKKCRSLNSDLDIRYVPIEMLNLYWQIAK